MSSGEIDDLTDVNVLVGKNNSGKSTVLDSIYLLNNVFGVEDCFGNYILEYILSKKSGGANEESLYYKYNSDRTIAIDVECSMESVGESDYSTEKRREQSEGIVSHLEYNNKRWYTGDLAILNAKDDGEILRDIEVRGRRVLSNVETIDDMLNTGSSRRNSDIQEIVEKLGLLKANIHNTQYFHSGIFQIFESMEEEIWRKLHRTRGDREVYSTINDIYNENIDHITYAPDEEGEHLRFLYDDYASASSSLGDGLRFTFILLSALESYESGVALIEEPENHQHPSAYSGLAESYSSYSQQTQTQLFIATHSYDFISELVESTKKYGLDLNIFHLSLDGGELETRKMNRPDVEMLEDIGIDPRRLEEYG